MAIPQAEQAHLEKLKKLRTLLAAGATSPKVGDFDPNQFIEEMRREYSTE